MNVNQLALKVRDYARANYIKTEVMSLIRYVRTLAPNKKPMALGFMDDARELVYTELGESVPPTLPAGSAPVGNGVPVQVRNSAAADAHPAVSVVTAGALTGVNLAATVAMVDNSDTVVIQNSGGTVKGASGTAVVANGVVTAVRTPATSAVVVGGAQTGVTVTGTYTSTVSFTITSGNLTGITLS